MKFLCIIFVGLLYLHSYTVVAATINAASCSEANVNTAISSSVSGDIVVVPAGSCTWANGIAIPDSKKITLQGAGMNSTVITGELGLGASGSRVTGFEFTGNVSIYTEGYGFRIDHSRIRRSEWGNAVQVVNTSSLQSIPVAWGLIDHNEIINGRVNAEGTNALLSEGNQQHVLWATVLDLGGQTSIYVEDNTFTNPGGLNPCNFIDGNYGGRYVFRYNTTDGCALEAHSAQEGGQRGIRSWEIYGNIINKTGSEMYFPFRIRAGTGTIFYNSIIGNWSVTGIGFDNVRSYASGIGGMCDGTSWADGNENGFGWPCRDQIGRSADNPQWEDNPPGAYTQASVPAFVWRNRNGSNSEIPVYVINDSENHIISDRDYYPDSASFNGTSGTGAGTLAARPSTCTTGVGYWATDQSTTSLTGLVGASHSSSLTGTLYKCTATNTWTSYYTPYTYPHPMTATESGAPVLTSVSCSPSSIQLPSATSSCTAVVASGTPTAFAWSVTSCAAAQCSTAGTGNPATYACAYGGACTVNVLANSAEGNSNSVTTTLNGKYRKPSGLQAN